LRNTGRELFGCDKWGRGGRSGGGEEKEMGGGGGGRKKKVGGGGGGGVGGGGGGWGGEAGTYRPLYAIGGAIYSKAISNFKQ